MKQETLSIEDLARHSGLSVRTVRYYIQQGLLPGPDTAGKYASYSQRHLNHLQMVQRLKRLHLPLKEIKHLIASMSPGDIERLLAMQNEVAFRQMASKPHAGESTEKELSSARDYIEDLAMRQERVRHVAEQPPAYTQPQSDIPERWSKIRLAEGVELNVREQEARALRKEIDLLLETARKIFGKGIKK